MWTSTDGRVWARLSDAQLAIFAGASVSLITGGPRGLIAFGFDDANTDIHRAWYSPDGMTWSAAPQFAAAFLDGCPDSVASVGYTFVAMGGGACKQLYAGFPAPTQ